MFLISVERDLEKRRNRGESPYSLLLLKAAPALLPLPQEPHAAHSLVKPPKLRRFLKLVRPLFGAASAEC